MAAKMNGKNSDAGQTEAAWGAAALLLVITCLFIWWKGREYLVYPIYALNYVQIEIISFIKGGLGPVGSKILEEIQYTFSGVREAEAVKGTEVWYVMDEVGKQTRWVIALMILGLTALVGFRMTRYQFTHAYNLSALAAFQATYWRVALAGSEFDPEVEDPGSAPALRPIEWIKREDISLRENRLDEKKAAECFARQLGKPYAGFAPLPIYVKALAVLFALSRDRDKRCQKYKEELATIWTVDRPNADKRTEELMKPFLADPGMVPSIEKILRKHAYVNTGMTGLFEIAKKKGGVLACAEIRWMKPLDRSLWYSLENVGRNAYFIEAAGSRGHYFAEVVGRGPKVEPYVEQAVDGLGEYLRKQGIEDAELYFARLNAKD